MSELDDLLQSGNDEAEARRREAAARKTTEEFKRFITFSKVRRELTKLLGDRELRLPPYGRSDVIEIPFQGSSIAVGKGYEKRVTLQAGSGKWVNEFWLECPNPAKGGEDLTSFEDAATAARAFVKALGSLGVKTFPARGVSLA